MLIPLFITPLFSYKVENWNEKKRKLLKLVESENLERSKAQSFLSDRGINKDYTENLLEILNTEFNSFLKELGAREIDLHTAWTVKYEQGDFHPPHSHSSVGYSGIIYLDYDKDYHTPTYFIDPIIDPVYDKTNILAPQVDEGVMHVVPSNVLHFTYPNTSDKIRQIIGFDLHIK